MKKLRLGLIAIATIAGLGHVFANKAAHGVKGTTYYVITETASTYFVTTTSPADAVCIISPNHACTITSVATPNDDGGISKSDARIEQTGEWR